MRLLVIKPEPLARRLLKLAGTTYAAEAGIRIRDKPMPLFQLLVLCMLASKPIGAATAARAARELFLLGPADTQSCAVSRATNDDQCVWPCPLRAV